MNQRMIELYQEASEFAYKICKEQGREGGTSDHIWNTLSTGKFAELIVQECCDKIETHRIPVGNSAAGEMACEWTYAALKEIRDEIKEHFGVE